MRSILPQQFMLLVDRLKLFASRNVHLMLRGFPALSNLSIFHIGVGDLDLTLDEKVASSQSSACWIELLVKLVLCMRVRGSLINP
jgi:hypothetical protein